MDQGTHTLPEDPDEVALLNDITRGEVTFPNIQGELVAGDGRGAGLVMPSGDHSGPW